MVAIPPSWSSLSRAQWCSTGSGPCLESLSGCASQHVTSKSPNVGKTLQVRSVPARLWCSCLLCHRMHPPTSFLLFWRTHFRRWCKVQVDGSPVLPSGDRLSNRRVFVALGTRWRCLEGALFFFSANRASARFHMRCWRIWSVCASEAFAHRLLLALPSRTGSRWSWRRRGESCKRLFKICAPSV